MNNPNIMMTNTKRLGLILSHYHIFTLTGTPSSRLKTHINIHPRIQLYLQFQVLTISIHLCSKYPS
jgi:hypothetical protein